MSPVGTARSHRDVPERSIPKRDAHHLCRHRRRQLSARRGLRVRLVPGTLAGRRALYHPGDNAGFGALNVWLPDDDRHLIVLTNEERIDLEALFGELIARTFPK